jgi:signal transduction histidine kinase
MVLPAVYEALFAQSPIGACLLTPDHDPTVIAVNAAFLRSAGRAPEDLVGRRLFDVFPADPSDPGDTGLPALRTSLARVLATGRVDLLPLQRYPIVVQTSEGPRFEERYWTARSTPIHDAAGRIVCIEHRTEDVTERHRVDEALRRNTERQTFALALADRIRPLTAPEQIARTASAMLGARLRIARVTYVEVDEASGTFVQRHWQSASDTAAAGPPERRRLEEFGAEIIATLRRGEPLVIRDVASDPRTRAHAAAYASIGVRSNLAIPLVKAGQLTLVLSLQHDAARDWGEDEIAIALDVAERTWAAAENARAQQALVDADRRKDEFLAMLAHELRNPLAPISVAAEVLGFASLDAATLRSTSAILARQVRHMTGLIDDLLDVSRVTRGSIRLDFAVEDMNKVVADALEQVRPLIESHAHAMTLTLAPEPARVRGDAKRLVQIVGNLLNNAAKYTPRGGRIRCVVRTSPDTVRIDVEDTGVGIPAALQSRIFDKFAQAERSADRAQGGLGLGLALVKSLVEMHGGRVAVESEGADRGTRFSVTLPRVAADTSSGDAPAAAPIRDRDDLAGRGRQPALDVLVVDDNADAAEMLRLLLEEAGHHVRVFHDPIRALEAAAHHLPQVALIDIGLPGLDGHALVRRLHAMEGGREVYCVAVTGYGQAADRARAVDAGFDVHVVKPPDPERLLAMLHARFAAD